jgi:hypothetical protein
MRRIDEEKIGALSIGLLPTRADQSDAIEGISGQRQIAVAPTEVEMVERPDDSLVVSERQNASRPRWSGTKLNHLTFAARELQQFEQVVGWRRRPKRPVVPLLPSQPDRSQVEKRGPRRNPSDLEPVHQPIAMKAPQTAIISS